MFQSQKTVSVRQICLSVQNYNFVYSKLLLSLFLVVVTLVYFVLSYLICCHSKLFYLFFHVYQCFLHCVLVMDQYNNVIGMCTNFHLLAIKFQFASTLEILEIARWSFRLKRSADNTSSYFTQLLISNFTVNNHYGTASVPFNVTDTSLISLLGISNNLKY